MSNRAFTYGGRDFQLNKIDAFKQFHIVRRIGPILTDILPAMKDAGKFTKPEQIETLPEAEKFEMVAKFAGPVMQGLSKLTDADAELVLFGLLSAVEMKQATGNWAKVATNSMLLIQDLELPALLVIAGQSFFYNLSGFFGALPQK